MMAEAAVKVEEEYFRVRRVMRHDLIDKGPWLVKRIGEVWPHLDQRQIMTKLISCCDQNEYLFVRTENAFLLARMVWGFFEMRPDVQEIFCLAETTNDKHKEGSDAWVYQDQRNKRAIHQAALLYEDLLRFAQTQGAKEIMIDKYSDVPLPDKEEQVGPDTIRARIPRRMFEGRELFFRVDGLLKKT